MSADDLHCARLAAPSFFVATHHPQIGGVEHDALLGSSRGSFYLGVACGRYRDRSLSMPTRIRGHIGGGSPDGLGSAFDKFVGHQLKMDLGLHRVVIVIHSGYVEQRGLADTHGIAHRLDVDAEGSAGGEKASAAGDLAIGLVCDRGLDGVILIVVWDSSGQPRTAWGR